MSTPDPRTEAAYKIVRDWYVNGGPHDLTKRKDLIDAITDALTTEAARVRGECVRQAEMIAAATAHRACCGSEHDPANGKIHGCCVVCGVDWPCETAQLFLKKEPT